MAGAAVAAGSDRAAWRGVDLRLRVRWSVAGGGYTRAMGLVDYLETGVWKRDLRAEPWHKRVPVAALRALLHIIADFRHLLFSTRASALTMTTLLALVPIAALVFSVARGFGFGQELDATLIEFGAELPAGLQGVVEKIREFVAAIDFRQLGMLSSLIVLYTGMSLFVRVEGAINDVWRSAGRRSWLRRFSDFVALTILVPGLGLASITLGTLLESVDSMGTLRDGGTWLAWLYEAGLGFVPHVLLGLALTALYRFMPNTAVTWKAALTGGFVAGPLLILMNGVYVEFQIGVSQNNAIYATLAALPLLIVYLQFAWTIVLLGAGLSHGVQHADLLGSGRPLRDPGPALRERLAVAITDRVVRQFESGEGALRVGWIATQLDLPRPAIETVCAALVEHGVLERVEGDRLLPARPPATITVDDARAAVRGELPEDLTERLDLRPEHAAALAGAERAHRESLHAVGF